MRAPANAGVEGVRLARRLSQVAIGLWAALAAPGAAAFEVCVYYQDFSYTQYAWATSAETRPVRFAKVTLESFLIWSETTHTGANGCFLTNAPVGFTYTFTVYADSDAAKVTAGGQIWSSFVNRTVTGPSVAITIASASNRGENGLAGALSLLQTAIEGHQYASLRGTQSPRQIELRFPEGCPSGAANPCYHVGSPTISVPSGRGFHDDAILHEYAHFLWDEYTENLPLPSPAPHAVCVTRPTQTLGFSEGWADYVAAAVRGRSWHGLPGEWFDAERGIGHSDVGDCAIIGDTFEGSVLAVLWDARDGPSDEPFDAANDEARVFQILDQDWENLGRSPTLADFRSAWNNANLTPIWEQYAGGMPVAEVDEFVVPPALFVGQSGDLKMSGRNKETRAAVGSLSLGFPSLTGAGAACGATGAYMAADADVVPIDPTLTVRFYPRGCLITNASGTRVPAEYLLVEGEKTYWTMNETHTVTLRITPKVTGPLVVLGRMALGKHYSWTEWPAPYYSQIDRSPSKGTPGVPLDQQGFSAFSRSMTVTQNTSPTLSDIPDRETDQDVPTGVIPFMVGDAQTPATALEVTATSSNPTLLPESGILLAGSGASRSVQLFPAAGRSGQATVTVRVSDGQLAATDVFVLTVRADTLTFVRPATGSPNPVAPGGLVQIDVEAVDSLGHAIAYFWFAVCDGLPSNGFFDNPSARAPVWTAPPNATGIAQTCGIVTTATDLGGHAGELSFGYPQTVEPVAADTLTITAAATGTPNPVASGGRVDLSVSATDSRGHTPAYTWTASCTGLGSNGSFDAANIRTPVWTAPSNTTDAQQSCALTAWITDPEGTAAARTSVYSQAVLAGNTFELVVSKSGSGSGTVTAVPAGIDCGAVCSAHYPADTEVTLTAVADSASTFTGWLGWCEGAGPQCSITMDQDTSVTAVFTQRDAGLLLNGGFDDGLAHWTTAVYPGCAGTRTATLIGSDPPFTNVLELKSVGAGGCGGSVAVSQDVVIPLAGQPPLTLSADVKVVSSTVLNGCGNAGGETPLEIYVRYRGADLIEKRLIYLFSYAGGSCGSPSPIPGATLFPVHVPQGEWHAFRSADLRPHLPTDGVITGVTVVGGGWDFLGRADNLRLEAGPLPDPIFGDGFEAN